MQLTTALDPERSIAGPPASASVFEVEPHEARSTVRLQPRTAVIAPLQVSDEALKAGIVELPVALCPADIDGPAELVEDDVDGDRGGVVVRRKLLTQVHRRGPGAANDKIGREHG